MPFDSVTYGAAKASATAQDTAQASQLATKASQADLDIAEAAVTAIQNYPSSGRYGCALPLPPVATRGMWCFSASDGTNTTMNSRIRHQMTGAVTEVRLVYANQNSRSTTAQYSITVKAGISNSAENVFYPVYFRGSRTVVIEGGGFAVSDPIFIKLAKGDVIYSRTYVTCASGDKFPLGYSKGKYTSGTDGAETGTDKTDKTLTGTIAESSIAFYGPCAVIGRNDSKSNLSIAIMGDSIAYGQGEANYIVNNVGLGPIARALNGNFNYLNFSFSGESINTFSGVTDGLRYILLQGCTHLISNLGINNMVNSESAATIKGKLIAMWVAVAAAGMKCYHTTITPSVTGSVFGLDTQTVTAYEAVRVDVNDWLRDDAPMLNGAAVATGSSAAGTLRAGDTGHPLTYVFDVTGQVESSLNSGKWKQDADSARAVNWASGAWHITSATDQFTAADIGSQILVPGAGVAGADLVATIQYYYNARDIGTTGTTASTSVTGAAATIRRTLSSDGIHPSSYGHSLMALGIDTTQLV